MKLMIKMEKKREEGPITAIAVAVATNIRGKENTKYRGRKEMAMKAAYAVCKT